MIPIEEPLPTANDIRSNFLETKSYGPIHFLQVGEWGQPLILVIHGSGPKNSSKAYEFFLYEYVARISYLERYYIVAIDCPGYGQSPGSKQAIKTFPLQLLEQILEKLRYQQYFILMGHSQGGAAIFNAVYEMPSICQIMVQERPVCGNIQRFRKFEVPTLLIYDIEDDGHPIWQGKLLYKELKNSEFYTFRSSRTPYWVSQHLWDHILQFINRWVRNPRNPLAIGQTGGNRGSSLRSRSLNQRSERPGRSIDQRMQRRRQPEPIVNRNRREQRIQERTEKSDTVTLQQLAERMEMEKDLQDMDIKEMPREKEMPKQLPKQRSKQLPKQFLKEASIELPKEPQKEEPQELPKQPIQLEKPKLQNATKDEVENPHRCSVCLETYYHPVRTNCNHIFCQKCLTETMLVNAKCPLCRGNIVVQQEIRQLHQQLVTQLPPNQLQKRQNDFQRFKRMMQSIVFVEMGNTSVEVATKQSSFTKTKKKYNWQLFVIEPRNLKFEYVEFNINMGEPNAKPVRVKSAPWVYASRGTFSFSCQIKIMPKSNEYAAKTVIHRIEIYPGKHSKKIALRKKEFERASQQ